MNKKLGFKINKNENIDELNKDLNDYALLRLKFMQKSDKCNKTQINNFFENFYNAKLNTMFSIINYYINRGLLTYNTNPFCLLDNEEEIKKYSAKICKILSNLDITIISKTEELSNNYEKLTEIIENSIKTSYSFLRDNDFWEKFIEFNNGYNNIGGI